MHGSFYVPFPRNEDHPEHEDPMSIEPITRYGKADLQEFEEVITHKLSIAQNDLNDLRSSLVHYSGNGTDDTSFSSHNIEDGNSSLEREELMMLATRQEKFILQLNNALLRIHNGTYGVCRVTGELIPKARLLSVPHATMSMQGKQQELGPTTDRSSGA